MTTALSIAQNFSRAAAGYDEAASMQARVAKKLVQKAADRLILPPAAALDIGCGTGFVAQETARRWPHCSITAADLSPAMLNEAQRKVPHLRAISGDMEQQNFAADFDAIFCNMALHWFSQPRAALERWRGWLKPEGRIFAALPVAGSFAEWRALCAAEKIADGLWPLPEDSFALDIAARGEIDTIEVDYASAQEFLARLKATGAATPRQEHVPVNAAAMRRLLLRAPQPFTITYRVLYIEIQSPGSI